MHLKITIETSFMSNDSRDKNSVYLTHTSWNDMFEYDCTYYMRYVDHNGIMNEIGQLKIGRMNIRPDELLNHWTPELPTSFMEIQSDMFSLGQESGYYERIASLGKVGRQILESLNDMVLNENLYDKVKNEPVTMRSLMRFVTRRDVDKLFRGLIHGVKQNSEYNFSYSYPSNTKHISAEGEIEFSINPKSLPPSNIHSIIGSNGAGKSKTLELIAKSLSFKNEDNEFGTVKFLDGSNDQVSNIIMVRFSAFDEFDLELQDSGTVPIVLVSARDVRDGNASTDFLNESNVYANSENHTPMSPAQLIEHFADSATVCLSTEDKKASFKLALKTLSYDSFYESLFAKLPKIIESSQDDQRHTFKEFFSKLSSGHKIVVLALVKIIEHSTDRSLILLDEPEVHLHPPLLAAFLRVLSQLLSSRNSAAIVATHSPVVLQEVPADCVWVLRNSGGTSRASRPQIETFGQNVAVLTREVFDLEMERTGFYSFLKDNLHVNDTYSEFTAKFDNKLGSDARSAVRVWLQAARADAQ